MKYCAALLILFAVAVAQDKVVDPGGWTKAKWGMTSAQIEEAFPEAKDIAVAGYHHPLLGLQQYEIGAIKYRVTFEFATNDGKPGGLISVALKTEDTADMPAVYADVGKDLLLRGLRDKYGEPTSTQDRPDSLGVTHDWKWLLPQTTLDLTYVEARERKYRFTMLQYSKRSKSDQL